MCLNWMTSDRTGFIDILHQIAFKDVLNVVEGIYKTGVVAYFEWGFLATI